MARLLEDILCKQCNAEEVYMDVKEEPGLYKIGATCFDCEHDYGVLHRIPRTDVEHLDEVYELGEQSITDILNPPQ